MVPIDDPRTKTGCHAAGREKRGKATAEPSWDGPTSMGPMDHERWSEAQKRTTVVVDGKELEGAYRDEGSGEPVFLHGIPTWSFLWRQVALRLEGEFRTIVPDFVGYGNSDRREGFDRSIRAQEQALAGLVEELELDRFHVVAHDIGGGVALRYGAHTDGRIDQLVCSNATCYGSWPVGYIAELGLPRTAEMSPEEFRAELDEAFLGGLERDEPEPDWTAGIEAPWLRGRASERSPARRSRPTPITRPRFPTGRSTRNCCVCGGRRTPNSRSRTVSG
jgi:pimeloyl-ACP methyl ester carboxylesterase